MIERLKKNAKIKMISLLSAFVLWTYVVAVVDPEDTRLYENIPITITNLGEINNLGLVVDPEEDLVTSLYIKSNLSKLQKFNPNNINVYGTIHNPIEGQNQLELRASVSSDKVTVELKSNTIAINLEKNISKEESIIVNINGKYKDNVDTVDLEKDSVIISGPRSKVEAVEVVQAELVIDNEDFDTYSKKLNLVALDSRNRKVENVKLEFDEVNAKISFLQQKEVNVNVVFSSLEDRELVQGEDFKVYPSVVSIRGSADNIANITSINTEPIDIDNSEANTIKVALQVPEGISVSNEQVDIKIFLRENILEDVFTYDKSEIELLNNENDISLDEFDIPDEIKVSVKYERESDRISKDDLKLYIDLSEGFENEKDYQILHNDLNVLSIDINPSYIKSK